MRAVVTSYSKDPELERLVRKLVEHGYELFSSRGTKQFIEQLGLPVTDIADYTGEAPHLDHRLVTIHPKVEGGFLALDTQEHRAELEQMGAKWFDLAYVNLYPVLEEIAKLDATEESVIEKTDVGGPLLMSAAAKGRRIILCDPADVDPFIKWLDAGRANQGPYIRRLAAKADAVAGAYRGATAQFHSDGEFSYLALQRVAQCRYGENAYQQANLLRFMNEDQPLAMHNFQHVGGKAPGNNNWCDVSSGVALLSLIAASFEVNYGFVPKIAVVLKHTNACGMAIGEDTRGILAKMVIGDPDAIFGGVAITNFPIGIEEAQTILYHESEKRRLIDGIVAPEIAPEALDLLSRKKTQGCFFLTNPALGELSLDIMDRHLRYTYVIGGMLVQTSYSYVLDYSEPRLEWMGEFSDEQKKDLLLAQCVAWRSTSNSISIVKDGALIANAVGQQRRVLSSKLALMIAADGGHDLQRASAASDSFFPFPDGLITLAEAGVINIFATSGSIQDGAVRTAARERGVNFLQVPDVLGRGFCGHRG